MSQGNNPFLNPDPPNPYATNFSALNVPDQPIYQSRYPLASLGMRFLGALIDNFCVWILSIPGIGMMILGSDFIQAISEERDPEVFGPVAVVGAIWCVVCALAILVAQIVLLATRSQSIGKYFLKMQIFSIDSDEPADFVKAFLLRSFVNGFIAGILSCVPFCGFFLGSLYRIVDACFIFGEERRCLHDLIASTKVVDIS